MPMKHEPTPPDSKMSKVPMSYEALMQFVPSELKEEFEQIEKGTRLPDLYRDVTFKRIFDADMHPERAATLFRLIFGQEADILSSAKSENSRSTIYTKKTILDLMFSLRSGGYFNLEMQAAAQDFLLRRTEVYTSDMILMLYTTRRGESKQELDFADMKQSYFVLLMKESPEVFRNHPAFLHRRQSMTDTGIPIPHLVSVVYIELDKCRKQWEEGCCPPEYAELALWLCAISDINSPRLRPTLMENPVMLSIMKELADMGKDREEMSQMLFDKYEEAVRYSYLQQAIRSGRKEGREIGLEQGREIGFRQGKADSILLLLSDLAPVPSSLSERVRAESDEALLTAWVKLAAKAESLKEFCESAGIQADL